jgi:arylsulfatase A-like enzyme
MAGFPAFAADAAALPNIIFIMADDLGYGDLGCYGQRNFTTPNIDRLAKEGLRFTNYYAGSTVCAPSRCVLMTGYHTGHCLIRGNARDPLRPEDVTVAEVLKARGYATGLFGKWGLGEAGSTGVPNKQGFDEFFGYLNQHHAHNYYPTFLWKNEERFPLRNVVPNEDAQGGGKASERVEYSHDLVMERAYDFVERHRERPFFLYLSLTIPHANNEARGEGMEVPELGEFAEMDWPAGRKGHAAMITRMDRDVGRLIDQLRELKLEQRTLVMFTSDNGPHNEGGYQHEMNDSNGPLRGAKRDLYEGGIRVPMVAWWPDRIEPGSTTDHISGQQDLMPTLAEFALAERHVPDDIDGISFAPTLLGNPERQKMHEYLYWAFYERGGAQAIRAGQWKLVEQPKGTPPQLFDLSGDLGEERNLAADHADVVDRLARLMEKAYRPSEKWSFPK